MDNNRAPGLVTARKSLPVIEHYLVGVQSSSLPYGQIPVKRDILKLMIFEKERLEREEPGGKNLDLKKVVSMCCLSKIKERYQEASIPIQTDFKIVQKVIDLYKYYKYTIVKYKDAMGASNKKKRDLFAASLDKIFDVENKADRCCSFSQVLNVVQHQTDADGDRTSPLQVSVTTQLILGKPRFVTLSIRDPSNTARSFSRQFRKCDFTSFKKQEGLVIEFEKFPELLVELLEKCLSESQSSQPTFFLKMDLSYSKSVLEFTELNKLKHLVHLSLSLTVTEENKVAESQGPGCALDNEQDQDVNVPSGSGLHLHDDDGQTEGDSTVDDDEDDEEEYHAASPRKKPRRSLTILLKVPVDILAMTKQAASELKLSPAAHAKIISAVILASGGDLDDFPISTSSSRRDKARAEGLVANKIKTEFRKKMDEDKSIKLICHFDGKKLPVINSDKVKTPLKDRVAILVKSPDIPFGEQLMAVPQLVDGKGEIKHIFLFIYIYT